MKDIYPMWKMCRMFLRNNQGWQKNKLRFEIISRGSRLPDEDNIEKERVARTFRGEGRGQTKTSLGIAYIIEYYPDHRVPNDVFGTKAKLDKDDSLPHETRNIVNNCVSREYGFLEEDKFDSEIVYLTTKGRDFANPPYFFLFRKEQSWGLYKEYLKWLTPFWAVISLIFGYILGKL